MSAKAAIAQDIVDCMKEMIDNPAIDSLAQSAANLTQIVDAVVKGQIFTVITTLAGSILIVHVLIHLVDSVLQDKRDPDAIFKDIALLLFFGYLTAHTAELVTALASAGDIILQRIAGAIGGGVGDIIGELGIVQEQGNANFASDLEKKNLFVLVLDSALYKTFGKIISWIIQIIAIVAVYTVKIECFIRTLFSPLAIASIPEEGMRGPGGRYIKRFFACFLQYSVISIALTAYPILLKESIATPGEMFVVALAACGFAVVGLCMKASSLANEIAGA